jgi:hypothetical protein
LLAVAALHEQWRAYVLVEPLVACAIGSEVSSCFFQTESAMWTTSNVVGVMIVLTIVLPETNLADVEPARS